MDSEKYTEKGAELRDDSYEKAIREIIEDGPVDASSIEVVYTDLDLLSACQKGLLKK